LPAGPVQAGHQAGLDWVAARENDGYRRGRRLGRLRCRRPAGEDRGDVIADEISRKCRQALILTIRVAVYDIDVLALDVTSFS
jgi:hypothetical protein